MNNRQNRDQYDQGYQAGWNQQGRQQDQWDQPDYESDSFVNRNPNVHPGYGEVYHGNVKQREEETNRARGRNYGGMHEGRYQQDQHNYGNYGGYGQVGYTGGGHGAWDSYGSGSQDMGGNFNSDYGNRKQEGNWSGRSNYGQEYRTGAPYGYSGNYGYGYNRDRRRDDDNNSWWDRTKEKVSSWFNDDDDDDRRDYRSRDTQRRGSYENTGSSFSSRGEHRGKGPRGYQRSDERIREDVCYRLYEDSYVDASDIEVNVNGSEVVLTGTVRSREEKRRAEDLVENIMGVQNVENRIRVNREDNGWVYSGGAGTSDRNRMQDNTRTGDTTSRSYDNSLENRSYTGNSGDGSGIGNESGTTNEIIRNSGNLDKDI